MEIDHHRIMIYILIFVVAFALSTMLLGHIARALFDEYSNKLNRHIDLYERHIKEALSVHLANLDKSANFKNKIYQDFEKINDEIEVLHFKLQDLNKVCDKRESLESEIIKLKKIIERKEKKEKKDDSN
ncbi:MAG: hypothetical protein PHI38_05435 [Sulfurimonas sp.]|jgi:hypothetical protein|uniref:hypothetical protein n=1 Tax=Sulfurimonas sp. TaxID=2022749 RepID=UPI00260CE51D|nr:hypothetical protein [Sulfurimonas sp.]MDD3476291.1 hypothetical protein [Sulfurimonas sp.]